MSVDIITVLGFHDSECQAVIEEYDDEIQIIVLDEDCKEITYIGKANHMLYWCERYHLFHTTKRIDLSQLANESLVLAKELRDELIKSKENQKKDESVNRITRSNIHDIGFSCYFDDLINDEESPHDISSEVHVKGSTNLVKFVYRLDRKENTGIPEEFNDTLWETNEFLYSENEGLDKNRITSLNRVEFKVFEVKKFLYERVEEY
jgi:hypothetical protein